MQLVAASTYQVHGIYHSQWCVWDGGGVQWSRGQTDEGVCSQVRNGQIWGFVGTEWWNIATHLVSFLGPQTMRKCLSPPKILVWRLFFSELNTSTPFSVKAQFDCDAKEKYSQDSYIMLAFFNMRQCIKSNKHDISLVYVQHLIVCPYYANLC